MPDDSRIAWLALRGAVPRAGPRARRRPRRPLTGGGMAVAVAVADARHRGARGRDATRTRIATASRWALGAAATAALSAGLLVAIGVVFSCAATGCSAAEGERGPLAALAALRLAQAVAANAAATSSASSRRSPETIRPRRRALQSLAPPPAAAGASGWRRHGRRPRRRLAAQVRRARPRPRTPLAAAFSRVAATPPGRCRRRAPARSRAWRRRSRARPSRSRGRRTAPPGSSSSSSSRHSRVVGCAPVPNACPGSITTSGTPGRASAAPSHGGRTQSASRRQRPAGGSAFQRSSQSSGTSSCVDLDQRVAGRRLDRSGSVGQLAGRAVDRVLDDVAAVVDLLDAAGRELEQLGQHELGAGRAGTRTASRITTARSARLQLGEQRPRSRPSRGSPRSSVPAQPLEQLALLVA